MPLAYVLTDADSLSTLALKYLGDAHRANEIADYNKLNYPYLIQDKATLYSYFGSGYITVLRASYTSPVTLKQGWTFKTKAILATGGISKVFEIIEDTLIPAGERTGYVPLRCTVPGNFGNVTEYTITGIGDDTAALSGVEFLSVYNENKFTGGRELDVLATGDTIYIPTDYSEVIPDDVNMMLELSSGEDLVLDSNGDLVIETGGDLASVSGADNIRYAVASRLQTELGDVLYHPYYGTGYQDLIGKPNLANQEKLIGIAIYRSLAQEDRITEVAISSLSVVKTSVYITVSYKIAVNGAPDAVSLVL